MSTMSTTITSTSTLNLPVHSPRATKENLDRIPAWLQCTTRQVMTMRVLGNGHQALNAESMLLFLAQHGDCDCWQCCALPNICW